MYVLGCWLPILIAGMGLDAAGRRRGPTQIGCAGEHTVGILMMMMMKKKASGGGGVTLASPTTSRSFRMLRCVIHLVKINVASISFWRDQWCTPLLRGSHRVLTVRKPRLHYTLLFLWCWREQNCHSHAAVTREDAKKKKRRRDKIRNLSFLQSSAPFLLSVYYFLFFLD